MFTSLDGQTCLGATALELVSAVGKFPERTLYEVHKERREASGKQLVQSKRMSSWI